MAPGPARAEEPRRNAEYFFERAIAAKPTVHDVAERIRIGRGIDPDRMTEFSGIHESVSFPGDTDPEADDFQEEAYGQLRAEIRMTYAELASTRGQADEVRQSVELVRRFAETSNTLYASGKIDQPQALHAQIEWERMSQTLLQLEKREKVFSIRLDVLTGAAVENVVPQLEPLREYEPAFDTRELMEEYKSRRFFALFQQAIGPTSPAVSGEELHGLDSVEVESGAYISVARISLDDLYQRARRYRTALIPRAEQAHAARLESYKTGRVDFSALLEGIRELSEMRREYQEILGEMQVRKARLESATGRALD
jgi:hypothetical protein